MIGEPHDVTSLPPEEALLQPIECEVRLASSQSGCFREEKRFMSLPEIEPQFICCPVCSLITILIVLPQLLCLKYVCFSDWHMLSEFVLDVRKLFITASPSIDKSDK
jgi:hypothetical protein